MKKVLLAALAVIFMIYLGFYGMENQSSSGPFFMFVGVCTSVGLTLDIALLVRARLKKANLRKYRP